MTFNPNDHLMQLKSKEGPKDYLPVQFRVQWFREMYPNGTIDTDEIEVDLDREVTVEAFVWNTEKKRSEKVLKTAKGYARYKATVTDGVGGRATGHGSECAADFADFSEKAETKSIGRALAGLGFGTAFAPDFNEAHRIVDAPVARSPYYSNDGEQEGSDAPTSTVNHPSRPVQPAPGESIANNPINSGQLTAIKNLCGSLNRPIPADVNTLNSMVAADLIRQLTSESKVASKR